MAADASPFQPMSGHIQLVFSLYICYLQFLVENLDMSGILISQFKETNLDRFRIFILRLPEKYLDMSGIFI
jgi:hypothetical protein